MNISHVAISCRAEGCYITLSINPVCKDNTDRRCLLFPPRRMLIKNRLIVMVTFQPTNRLIQYQLQTTSALGKNYTRMAFWCCIRNYLFCLHPTGDLNAWMSGFWFLVHKSICYINSTTKWTPAMVNIVYWLVPRTLISRVAVIFYCSNRKQFTAHDNNLSSTVVTFSRNFKNRIAFRQCLNVLIGQSLGKGSP